MRVERDIAGFALPFSAGVLLAVYSGAALLGLNFLSFCLILVPTATLLLRRVTYTDFTIWISVCTVAFGCGLLSGTTGISSPYDMPVTALEEAALGFGSRMQAAIDAIPFSSPWSGALIKALLTGERSSMPPEVTEAFRDSGASHILSLSGLHLGIIYGIFSKVLSVLGNSTPARRIRSLTIIGLCGFYTLATGAGPSIVRSFLFILLGETARLTGRYRGLGQILLVCLVLQLVISPLSVRSVSFQLSFAAMAGIAFIYPWLRGFWPGADGVVKTEEAPVTFAGRALVRSMRWIWDSVALSVACQLTTGPLAYIYFGTFPLHFMLTNLISLPLTGFLIPCALLTLVLSVLGCCPPLLIWLTDRLVDILIRSLQVVCTM